MTTIAVVIPVYNESRWLEKAVRRVTASPRPPLDGADPAMGLCERLIILVDDGSTDGSIDIARRLAAETAAPGPGSGQKVRLVEHTQNQGKGAALRTGIETALAADADIILIHDADLEYDPADHAAVLRPILDGRADAVIGSRFLGQVHRVLYYWHAVANRAITTLSNMTTNLNLTDIECCTKAFRRDVLRSFRIRESRFGVEPELVAKLARVWLPDESASDGRLRRARVYEAPVSYAGRTYADGKKITWRDGFSAIRCILKYWLSPGIGRPRQ